MLAVIPALVWPGFLVEIEVTARPSRPGDGPVTGRDSRNIQGEPLLAG